MPYERIYHIYAYTENDPVYYKIIMKRTGTMQAIRCA